MWLIPVIDSALAGDSYDIVALSGSGSLTTGWAVDNVGLSGEGSLSAIARPSVSRASSLSGSGSLAVYGIPVRIDETDYSARVLVDSPLAYFKGHDTSGPLVDSAGSHTVVVTGTIAYDAAGILGTAVSLPGTAGNYGLADVALNHSNITLEAWIKTTGTGYIVHSRTASATGITFYVSNGSEPTSSEVGRAGIAIDGADIWACATSGTAVNDGKWHHIVGVLTGTNGATATSTNLTIFVDGIDSSIRSDYSAGAVLPITCPDGLAIGVNSADFASNLFAGALQHLAIYGTALSATLIAEHYRNPHPSAALTGEGSLTTDHAPTIGTYALNWSDTIVGKDLVFDRSGYSINPLDIPTDVGADGSLEWPTQGDNASCPVILTLRLASAATVSFWIRVEGEPGYDGGRFFIDDVEQQYFNPAWAGVWALYTYAVPVDTHELKWVYTSDGLFRAGQEKMWLALLSVTNVIDPPIVTGSQAQPAFYDMEDGEVPALASGSWVNSTNAPLSGLRSLRSPVSPAHNTNYDLVWTFSPLPENGVFRFKWARDSESNDEFIVLVGPDAFTGPWTNDVLSLVLPAGTTTVTHRFSKNASVSGGADACWVDDVHVPFQIITNDFARNVALTGEGSLDTSGTPVSEESVELTGTGDLSTVSFATMLVTGSAPVGVGSSSAASTVVTVTGVAPVGVYSSSATISLVVLSVTGSAPVGVGSSSAALTIVTTTGSAPVSEGSSSAATSFVVEIATGVAPVSMGSSSSALAIAAVTGRAPVAAGSSSEASSFVVMIVTGMSAVGVSSSSEASVVTTVTGIASVGVGSSSAASSFVILIVTGSTPVSVGSSSAVSVVVAVIGVAPVTVGSSSAVLSAVTEVVTGVTPITVGSSSAISTGATATGSAPVTVGSSSETFSSVPGSVTGVAPVDTGSSSAALTTIAVMGITPVSVGSSSSTSSSVAESVTGSAPVSIGSSSEVVAPIAGSVDYTAAIYSASIGTTPEALFDWDNHTYWFAGAYHYAPQWCQVELGIAQEVTWYTIRGHSQSNLSPTGWEILGSNNGSAWTTLDTQIGQSISGITSPAYPIAVSGSYLYYRLNVTYAGAAPAVVELTLNTAPLPDLTGFALDITAAGSGMTLEQPTVEALAQIEMFGGGSSGFNIHIPFDVVSDPITGKAPYRLIVAERDGTRLAELSTATIGDTVIGLNASGGVNFTMPADSPEALLCIPTKREIQVWRGKYLIDTFVILKAAGDGKTVTFQCVPLNWYFSKRVMGLVPTPNLLKNGSFEEGERYWSFDYIKTSVPGGTSIPAKPPIHSIVHTSMSGSNALHIEGSNGVMVSKNTLAGDANFEFDVSTLTSAGISAVNALCAGIQVATPHLTCYGNTDNIGSSGYNYTLGLARANSVKAQILNQISGAVVTTISYGETRPAASNATSGGRAENRRVDVEYSTTQLAKGHRQYAGQNFSFTNPTTAKHAKTLTLVGWVKITSYLDSSKDGWGVYMQRRAIVNSVWRVLGTAFVELNKDTPRNAWLRMECSLEVPADDVAYYIDVRLYPPSGVCIWDEVGVTASDELGFFDVDEALIVKALVEHAQDPAMGKSTLNIETNCPVTGKTLTRQYPFSERMPISEAIAEFATLEEGMDMKVVCTPTSRTLTTYYPRKGSDRGVVFSLTTNIMTFGVDVDGSEVATTIIVQADGEGSDREEGVVQDASQMDGLVLEKVYSFTPLSPISSLHAQAITGWARYSRPITIPSVVMMPGVTDDLLGRVSEGDIVTVDIHKGWIQVHDKYRITSYSLNPTTDQLTYTLVVQDVIS